MLKAGFLLSWMSLLCAGAVAGSNQFDYDVGVFGLSDDNYGLRQPQKNDVLGGQIQLQGDYQYKGLAGHVGVRGRVVEESLNTENVDENDIILLALNAGRQSDISDLSASVSAIQDTTLADDALSQGGGRIDVDRKRYRASGTGQRYFSSTIGAGFNLTTEQVRFNEVPAQLNEYDYSTASSNAFWLSSAVMKIYGNFSFSVVDYRDNFRPELFRSQLLLPDKTEIKSGGVGFDWAMSENLKLDTYLGYRQTEYRSRLYFTDGLWIYKLDNEQEGNGLVSNITLNYKGERADVGMAYFRSVEPNSSGSLIDEKRITLSLDAEFSAVFSLTFDTFASQQRSDVNQISRDNIDVIYASLGTAWRVSKTLHLNGYYRYLYRKYVVNNVDTESNRIQVGVQWSPDILQW
ncbi:MAG: hypothetical protein CMK83_15180 [Pseudomonadales bacterium]|jgi:hypothetical protein|uniref:hypothetical protein n=1 Tax=unclassified Ketobacter TaxID=2639109 RepID=UPI000C62FA85|nr:MULTISPECIES: hypothetical protein [unclassified Ketobacter]MAQ25546.1 hypothetical protein [Pseudomonadales bacterium]TNC90434.1 MAG: hypothetical protein CSH49_02990 [Alcanivorax sp.]HAG94223.1 hypothetical protein [Gammaproteobacteria bacterium]MBI25752.1 hypothetical protein [Pseudomonadales bacterium]RLT91230.1 MAG: hypothetical protein D9N13_02485 [Ketobacter sp. GenoA1]|tara:strand:- start:26688 stop:27902 length:1215 start_codon:yes stop_codon:yes gene_type:complete